MPASRARSSSSICRAARAGYRWVLATVGANEAAGYQLATGDAVMAIGGFNGSDPAPTLAEFEKLVAAGEIHYFIGSGYIGSGYIGSGYIGSGYIGSGAGGGPGGAGGSSAGTQITSWVEAHFSSTTVGRRHRLQSGQPQRIARRGRQRARPGDGWDSWGRARSAALKLL